MTLDDELRRLLEVAGDDVAAVAKLVADRLDLVSAQTPQWRRRADRISRVLVEDTFDVVYQPIVDLRSHAIVGVEALTRFADPADSPVAWFQEAAAVGRGVELEVQAITKAAAAFDQLPEEMYLAVNVSPTVALSPALHRELRTLPLHRLVFEVTEHHEVADYARLNDALGPLRAAGMRLAVDDAGAGFASLRHILRMAPDIIKLDASLIRGIDRDATLRALSQAITSFGEAVDARVVAEGIECPGEYHALRYLGVDFGQGYLLHRPAPLTTIDLRDMPVSLSTSA